MINHMSFKNQIHKDILYTDVILVRKHLNHNNSIYNIHNSIKNNNNSIVAKWEQD